MDTFRPLQTYQKSGVHGRPDTELVVLAREGSKEAAGALFDRYWILAWRTAYAVTADHGLADTRARRRS
jgi:hypothetical protein